MDWTPTDPPITGNHAGNGSQQANSAAAAASRPAAGAAPLSPKLKDDGQNALDSGDLGSLLCDSFEDDGETPGSSIMNNGASSWDNNNNSAAQQQANQNSSNNASAGLQPGSQWCASLANSSTLNSTPSVEQQPASLAGHPAPARNPPFHDTSFPWLEQQQQQQQLQQATQLAVPAATTAPSGHAALIRNVAPEKSPRVAATTAAPQTAPTVKNSTKLSTANGAKAVGADVKSSPKVSAARPLSALESTLLTADEMPTFPGEEVEKLPSAPAVTLPPAPILNSPPALALVDATSKKGTATTTKTQLPVVQATGCASTAKQSAAALDSSTPSTSVPPAAVPVDRFVAIRDIVTGNGPSKTVVPNTATAGNEKEPVAKGKSKKKGDGKAPMKRKKPAKPMRKVLYAKKEAQQATTLLRDKGDLAECLLPNDCMFLGKNFWIFSSEQLLSVVEPLLLALDSDDTPSGQEKSVLKNHMIVKLASSFRQEEDQSKTVGDVQSIAANGKTPSIPEVQQGEPKEESQSNEEITLSKSPAGTATVPVSLSLQDSDSHETSNEHSAKPASEAVLPVPGQNEKDDTLKLSDGDKTALPLGTAIPVSGSGCEGAEGSTQKLIVDDLRPQSEVAEAVAASGDGAVAETSTAFPISADLQRKNGVDESCPQSEEVETVAVSGDDAVAETSVPISADLLRRVKKKLTSWKEAATKLEGKEKIGWESKFRLDGAIKFLFPMTTRNFLKSVKVEALWTFLSMKRTETGKICEKMSLWRHGCGLSEITVVGLARHFLCIASRVETALSSVPPVDANTRIWMKDPINSMTGAAREFLINEQKIYSAAKLVAMQTKILSIRLVAWRERKGMEPLKGSGKVAMISAWKTAAKEAYEAEAEPGSVIDMTSVATTAPLPKPEEAPSHVDVVKPKTKRKRTKSKAKLASERSGDYALHSELFLLDVLGDEVTKLVSSAGIKTAAELFDADTSTDSSLYNVLVGAKKATDSTSFYKLLHSWRAELRKDLDNLGAKKSSNENTASDASEKTPSSGGKVRTKRQKTRPIPSELVVSSNNRDADAIDALSTLTKNFLASTGRTTAYDFLSARTTDIALEFKDWREATGKPQLKGLGAIASVSGWKAAVRKMAKDMGLEDLAALEPNNKGSYDGGTTIRRRKWEKAKEDEPNNDDNMVQEFVAELSVPLGNGLEADGKEMLAVQNRSLPRMFVFELSLRTPTTEVGSRAELFVTYKGCGPHTATADRSQAVEFDAGLVHADVDLVSRRRRWILANVPMNTVGATRPVNVDIRNPFSALNPGNGLIDLSGVRGGIYPYKKQDLSEFKQRIELFISLGLSAATDITVDISPGSNNVLIQKVGHDKYRYLLFLTKPMEKGQTVALNFPSVKASLYSRQFSGTEFYVMHTVDEGMQTLCLDDLRDLLSWLSKDIFGSTGYSEHIRSETCTGSTFKTACERRRRLHWVSRRIYTAIGDRRRTAEDATAFEALSFDRQVKANDEDWKKLSTDQQADFEAVLHSHAELEMYWYMELDHSNGQTQRSRWCPRAKKLLKLAVDAAADEYTTAAGSDSSKSLSSLEALLKSKIQSIDFANISELDGFVVQQSWEAGSESSEIMASLTHDIEHGYTDAMALSSEHPHKVPTPTSLDTVACVNESTAGVVSIRMRQPRDVLEGQARLSAAWYRNLFWQISFTAISSYNAILGSSATSTAKLEEIRRSPFVIQNSVMKEPLHVHYKQALATPAPQEESCMPSTYQFFLGIVWPELRRVGWRLHAGATPSEVVFCPKRHAKKRSGGKMKHTRDRKRRKLVSEVNQMGLGVVRKASKRLLVAVTESKEPDEDHTSDGVATERPTVQDTLERFSEWLTNKFSTEKDSSKALAREKVDHVLNSIKDCFDVFAPRLAPIDGVLQPASITAGRRAFEVYRSEYLMQFLLMLPQALRQAELPEQELSDALAIVKELLDYMTSNLSLFEKRFHPPHEEYVDGNGQLSSQASLVSKVRSLVSSEPVDIEAPEVMEVVLEGDRASMTDFVITVMEQAIPFRATAEDVRKKHGRVSLGFPGLVCRHCKGLHNGRYFFSTIDSLTACYPVLEKHCLKCPAVPQDIKRKLTETRLRHARQRKQLPSGTQQAYYNRLWARLRKSKFCGHAPPEVSTVERTDPLKNEIDDDPSGAFDFTEHTALLDHVRGSKVTREVQEALDRYYGCIDYVGRIYKTSSMPPHFSPEWLLAKVLPTNRHHRLPANIMARK